MSQAEQSVGLLIASPQMHDPCFDRTVVLLCQHDDAGAIGLVINRDGPVTMGDVINRMELGPERENNDAPTWWGGPVGQGTGFVIWQGRIEPEEGWNVGENVAVSPSVERLTRLVQEHCRFHLCLGYAGWGPGQLAGEIETGSWLYADVDPNLIFHTPMEDRYDRALSLLGLQSHIINMTPIEA